MYSLSVFEFSLQGKLEEKLSDTFSVTRNKAFSIILTYSYNRN
jgi:hypothetical protein